MYLRESKQRRADGSVVTYLQLAENVWDAAKGRSQARIVHILSNLAAAIGRIHHVVEVRHMPR